MKGENVPNNSIQEESADAQEPFVSLPKSMNRRPWIIVSGGQTGVDRAGLDNEPEVKGVEGYSWALLLAERPQFADRCDFAKLGHTAWAVLLKSQPQFADKCGCWGEMDGWHLTQLLKSQPQLADKCDMAKLYNPMLPMAISN